MDKIIVNVERLVRLQIILKQAGQPFFQSAPIRTLLNEAIEEIDAIIVDGAKGKS